jgi:hypothetical protein
VLDHLVKAGRGSHGTGRETLEGPTSFIWASTVASNAANPSPYSVATAHTFPDGIKDHKLVLVARNQPDMKRRYILGHSVKAGSGNHSTGRKTLEQPTRLIRIVVIVRDIQPVVDVGASTALDYVSAAADDSRLAISIGDRTLFRTCQSFKGARGLSDVQSLEHSASIGAEYVFNVRILGHKATI